MTRRAGACPGDGWWYRRCVSPRDLRASHDEIYETFDLPAFESHWVADRVRAGRNCLSAWDVERLVTAHGITHVLDLREEEEWRSPWVGQDAVDEIARRGLTRLNISVPDFHAPTSDDLSAAVAFIRTALEDPDACVYVHCRAGWQRTATVLVAWYASAHDVDYDTALKHLKRKRRVLGPSLEQEAAARAWIEVTRERRT